MKVLIIEDDLTSRQVLLAQLRKLGYEASAASGGAGGLARWEADGSDLVITDWMMPETDGLELCRRIRAAGREKYTYIIMLTAVPKDIGYLLGMEAGVDDFVTKPCDIQELDARVRVAKRILALQTRRHQLEDLLPICPGCKRIQDREGEWQEPEHYLMDRNDARFSHGICPECYEKYVRPEIEGMKRMKKGE